MYKYVFGNNGKKLLIAKLLTVKILNLFVLTNKIEVSQCKN